MTVLGYGGEPFLHFGPAGVIVEPRSPTAAALRITKGRAGRTFVWHDARVRGLPPGIRHGRWTIPLVVDGKRERIAGEITRVPAPAAWPWLALGVPFVAPTALLLLLRRRPRVLDRSAVALAVLTVAALVTTATSFALASNASRGTWVESANEIVFAAVGVAVMARGSRDARVTAAGALGLLGLVVGLSKVPALTHGVVLSALPDTAARVEVALTLWASASATALGLVLFADVLE